MAKQCQHFLMAMKYQNLLIFAKKSWNKSTLLRFGVSCQHAHHVHRTILSSSSMPTLLQMFHRHQSMNGELRMFKQNLVRFRFQKIILSSLAISAPTHRSPNWSKTKMHCPSRTCEVSKVNNRLCTQSLCTNHTSEAMPTNVCTVKEAINWWTEKFCASGIPEPEISAKYIIAHVVGLKQLHELTIGVISQILKSDEKVAVSEMCQKRLNRVPVQYIIGEWDFRNLTLLMRPPVFIPCPETELLVELVLDHYTASTEWHFLEIGCGTGAISISLLSELPKAHVTVVEQSQDACMLTKENAIRSGVMDRLTIHHDEWNTVLPEYLHGFYFDAIVSNPPYISTGDLKGVDEEVSRYIDKAALNGGTDGLNIIKNICLQARHVLKPDAFIWLETDTYQADTIDEWLQQQSDTRVAFLKMYKDFSNKPRFCQLQLR